MTEVITECDASNTLSQEWLEGHIKIALERKSYEEAAKNLGKKARESAEVLLYEEPLEEGRRRDIAQLKVPFEEFVSAFRIIVFRTIKPQSKGGYRLYDLNEVLNSITGSDHVSSQLLDRMLSEQILRFNDAEYLEFLPTDIPKSRIADASEAIG